MMSREKCGGRKNRALRDTFSRWPTLHCGVEGADIVGPDLGIAGHECEVFAMRLGHEHTVERIGVVRRESADREGVVERDLETKSPSRKEVRDALIKGGGQLQAAESRFDCHLPYGDRADPEPRPRLKQGSCASRAEAVTAFHPPDRDMSIQEQVHHSMPKGSAISGGNGASKSSLIQIFPFNIPKVLRTSGFSRGTSRAMGLPALAMTISSPAATSSKRLERWVLAAWILTVFIN